MRDKMTKSDLSTGMVVKSADNLIGVVLLKTATCDGIKWFLNENSTGMISKVINEFEELTEYHDDLTHKDGNDLNIIKVYQPDNLEDYTTMKAYNEDYLIWERKEETKEITMTEIEEKFGCKVKIIG